MRLKSLVLTAAVIGAALSVPTPARATWTDMKTKMSHVLKGDPKKNAVSDAKSQTPAATPAPLVHKHMNGFPEPDKHGPLYQPQSEPQWWGDKAWKTNTNKDTWKGQ